MLMVAREGGRGLDAAQGPFRGRVPEVEVAHDQGGKHGRLDEDQAPHAPPEGARLSLRLAGRSTGMTRGSDAILALPPEASSTLRWQ